MEKYPLKGNSKSIALQSLVGAPNKNILGSSGSGASSTVGIGGTYQSVSKKVTCPYSYHPNQRLSGVIYRLKIDISMFMNFVRRTYHFQEWCTFLHTFLLPLIFDGTENCVVEFGRIRFNVYIVLILTV